MKAIERLAEFCKTGDLDEAKNLVAKIQFNPALREQNVLIQACKHGHMHIVRWLLEDTRFNKNRDDCRAFRVACSYGHLELAKMLKDRSGKHTLVAFSNACRKGHFEVAKWLFLDEFVQEAMYETITPEFYEEIPDKENKTSKWIKAIVDIRTKYNNLCPYILLDKCLENDDLNTFKFVCSCFADPEFGVHLTEIVKWEYFTKRTEHPKILEWIMKHKYATIKEEQYKDAWNSISNRRSSFEVVLCFLKHVPETIHLNPKSVLSKEEWKSTALCFLDKYRELWKGYECLVKADVKKTELIFQLYPQLTSYIDIMSCGILSAFKENNFELAQFLYSKYNGIRLIGRDILFGLYDITDSNYKTAFDITYKHIELYDYEIVNHFIELCSKNSFECAEYIMSQLPQLKRKFTEDVVTRLLTNYDFNDLNVMKWICKTFSINPQHFISCFLSSDLKIKQWLLETKGEIITDSTINTCFERGNLKIKQWLLETKPEIITDRTINTCFVHIDFETKKWLYETRSDIITESTIKRTFQTVCLNGKNEQISWLIRQRSELFDDDFLDNVFKKLCSKCMDSKYRFLGCSLKNLVEIALWFQSYRPERYQVKTKYSYNHRELDSYKIICDIEPIAVSTIETCSICYSENSDVITDCKHQFCSDCIEKWLARKNTCPICRKECYDFASIAQD